MVTGATQTARAPIEAPVRTVTATAVDWQRCLKRYLAPADSPVGVWLRAAADSLDTAGPLPLFGSRDWDRADHQTRLASALRAAEAWRRAGLYVEADLADALDDDAPDAWADRADDDRAWSKLARWVSASRNAPTARELRALRSIPAQPLVPPW